MNMNFVSLGAQCTTAVLFQRLNIKTETLPFDWMFSTPEFVYKILRLLLVDDMSVEDVTNHEFFNCDKRASLRSNEHHVTDTSGPVLINSKYNVAFPHDSNHEHEKFKRRLQRLKNIILDKNNFICFVYVAVSSKNEGNYTVDGQEPIQEVYENILKIEKLLQSVRKNYKIVIYDTTNKENHATIENENIDIYLIDQRHHWSELLPELIEKFDVVKSNLIPKE